MKVLILTNDNHDAWMWYEIQRYMSVHDIHIYHEDAPYPFELIESYDIGISFMYQYKVPAKQVNSRPWFNFHPAPLPEYKGRDLCYHAIANGEKWFGVTVHFMDENFDTGDIVEVFRFPIFEWYNAEDLSNKAINHSKKVFAEYLPLILDKTRVFTRTPNKGGTYYKKGRIIEEVPVSPYSDFGQFVRMVSFPSKGFHPRIDISGVKYKIVREE